ncbi:MAG TPA: type II secretion system protein [Methylobacter sp.]
MKANRQRGFSLLEILIAFSILALSLGILLKIFSAGVNTAGVAEEYTAAVQIAESLMAQTGVEALLQPNQATGLKDEKYQWQVVVSPFQFTAENLDVTTMPVVLFKVKVIVSWGNDNAGDGVYAASQSGAGAANAGGRQVELISLKLANKTS